MGRRNLFNVNGIVRALRRRPLISCSQCGYSWHPRGKNYSLKCPNCGVKFSNPGESQAGCGGIIAVLLILMVAGTGMVVCCGGLAVLSSIGKDTAHVPVRPPSKSQPVTKVQPVAEAEKQQILARTETPPSSDGKDEVTTDIAAVPEPSTPEPPKDDDIPPEFAGELAEGDTMLGPMREWTSADGKFHRKARYQSSGSKHVKLKREDGVVIDVERDRLSEADQQWLAAYLDWKHHGRKKLHSSTK